ncbi:MAG: hypothetical protein QGG36_09210 [Pirellulaceae bacterium]|jgi:hypothetical protein|nr:hypothetical protein [Pirellulaceae bacterium]MDP7015965.1 hypothetical protein [Pirellulaceae bacterium]
MTDESSEDAVVDNAPDSPEPAGRAWRSLFQFRLKTVLLVMLVIGVFLGGRASLTVGRPPSLQGDWNLEMTAGFVRTARILDMGDSRYRVLSGGVLAGVYELEKDRLVVVQPDDDRMLGLIWRWDGEKLLLIDEPANHPTGASYVGAVLVPPADE